MIQNIHLSIQLYKSVTEPVQYEAYYIDRAMYNFVRITTEIIGGWLCRRKESLIEDGKPPTMYILYELIATKFPDLVCLELIF